MPKIPIPMLARHITATVLKIMTTLMAKNAEPDLRLPQSPCQPKKWYRSECVNELPAALLTSIRINTEFQK
jgi:hypothetical protein